VLQACHAYEQAAGASWPSPALSAALEKAAGPVSQAVRAKIKAAQAF